MIRRIAESESIEATYSVHVTTETEQIDVVRDALKKALKLAGYPIAEIDVIERRDDRTEIIATLASTEFDPSDLDTIVEQLRQRSNVAHASRSASTQS